MSSAYGVKDEDLSAFMESVIDFASIGDAIFRPFKGYSSGMKGKLGFGFITALKPDVLLIDETLGVGDIEFRERAKERVREFIQRSGCVIISTHSLGLARELCNRGLVLESANLVSDENIEEAMLAYRGILKGV
jgi:ABC-type polysaccharide/polyol phosphate transport system ATPase subunit